MKRSRGKIIILTMFFWGILYYARRNHREAIMNMELSEKHLSLYLLMNKWVGLRQKGANVGDYLVKQGYNKIGIYGMNYVGKTLLRDLREGGVNVVCAVDKREWDLYEGVPVIHVLDGLKTYDLDMVIITPISYYDEIADNLEELIDCPIISIQDLLDDMDLFYA